MIPSSSTQGLDGLLAHGDFARSLARALLFDEHRADDVVQQAWLAALQRRPLHAGAARAWLATVIRRLAGRSIREEGRRFRREQATARPDVVPSAEEIAERENLRRRVLEAVLALEEPYRSTVLARFYESLTPSQVARGLGVPEATVRTRLRRALERLRETLDREFGDRRSWGLALVPLAAPAGPVSTEAAGEAPEATAGRPLAAAPVALAGIGAVAIVGLAVLLGPSAGEEPSHLVQGSESSARVAEEGPGTLEPPAPPEPGPDRVPTAIETRDEERGNSTAPEVGSFRRVVLHLFGGEKVEGALVDYRPPETYVLLERGARREVGEGSVEQVEFLDVTAKVERENRALADRVAALGDADPRGREKAAREIQAAGRRALDPLRALRSSDPAAAQRAASLAEQISSRAGKVVLSSGDSHSFGSRGARHLGFSDGELSVGFAGTDFGHFLDLGVLDSSTVRFEGGRLLAGGSPVATYELFARNLDPRPMKLVQELRPETGHVVLFRSVDDREGDFVGLLSIEKVLDEAVEMTWTELVSWDALEMERRVRREEEDWMARLRDIRSGEALLWARRTFGDYLKATFSFEFATRDHVGVTRNDWDFVFGNEGPSQVRVNTVTDDRSEVREVEAYHMEAKTVGLLPADGYAGTADLRVGGTYAVHTVDRDSDLWSLFRVTALDPGKWVEIRWRVLEKK